MFNFTKSHKRADAEVREAAGKSGAIYYTAVDHEETRESQDTEQDVTCRTRIEETKLIYQHPLSVIVSLSYTLPQNTEGGWAESCCNHFEHNRQ